MKVDPLMIIVVVGTLLTLLIERIFYYRSKYRKKNNNPGNPNHGERIQECETEIRNLKENNTEAHRLIREEIRKLGGRIDGMRR